MKKILQVLLLLSALTSTKALHAQGSMSLTESKFHDIFITAGYSTAFGAALGAAFIGLTDHPGQNMHFIAVGASLGFITGSALGTYMVVLPSMAHKDATEYDQLLATTGRNQAAPLEIRPYIDTTNGSLHAITGSVSLLTF